MSENMKRLREEESKHATRARKKEYAEFPRIGRYHYESLAGISNIERQVEEARKEEQRIKERLKETKEELRQILEVLEEKLRIAAINEDNDYMEYVKLAEKYSDIPTARHVFKELADVERTHAEYLRRLASKIRGEYVYI